MNLSKILPSFFYPEYQVWVKAPLADLNILELPDKEDPDLGRLQEIPNKLSTACLFTLDSALV